MTVKEPDLLPSLWDKAKASGMSEADQLVYASNLLGSDPRITNFGGGNTSVKVTDTDPLTGEPVEVLWVKGSGGDLGTAKKSGFASLYLDKVLGLEARYENRRKPGSEHQDPTSKIQNQEDRFSRIQNPKSKIQNLTEDDIVALYAQCIFNLNPAAPSIDTPLHAFVPYKAVSHMHSDAVIALAASEDVVRLTQEVFGGKMGFLPWKRPGFELGLMLRDLIEANPRINSAMMGSHGFICWADSWEECYDLTLGLINQAAEYIERKSGSTHAFGDVVRERPGFQEARLGAQGAATPPRMGETPMVLTGGTPVPLSGPPLIDLLPRLRGKVAYNGQKLIGVVDTSEPVLEFLSRSKMAALSALGTSCPDHFLRTKIRPLVLELDGDLDAALADFRANYAAYYERCKRPDSPAMRNPNPSVVLIPGVGMISFGKNVQEATVTGKFYRNAIEVMRGAETVSKYTALPEQEAFDIEYWLLEEAKLKRQPPEKELSRQIAVITGGASGIGKATALKMAALGAHVVLLDINQEHLDEAVGEVEKAAGIKGAAKAVRCDVTDPSQIDEAFAQAILAFGGVDIVVANAGNARRGTVAETSPEDYAFLSDLLIKGYFDTVAAATRLMVKQGTGGSIVVVGSKNGVAAGSNAALYSAAKAFELHLMRCTALDFAKQGIRCNAINPDGVVVGSSIWSDAWKEQTAKSLGIKPDELVEHYRKRSLLGTVVTPDDCAEAICWLASDKRSSRTTGAVIPVDGGNKEGFLR